LYLYDDLHDILGGSPWLTWKGVILRLGLASLGLLGLTIVCFTCLIVAAMQAGM